MIRTSRIPAALLAKTLLFVGLMVTFGCKSTPDAPAPLTSLQGSWKITGVTISPAYSGVTDLNSGLQLMGETCIKDAVVTFNAGGTISNNMATQSTCANATNTQRVVNSFFGPTTKYTESGNQVTLSTNGETVSGTRVYTATTVSMTAKLPTDPSGATVPTTYLVMLTRQ